VKAARRRARERKRRAEKTFFVTVELKVRAVTSEGAESVAYDALSVIVNNQDVTGFIVGNAEKEQ